MQTNTSKEKRIREIHGDKYDLTETDLYAAMNEKNCMICPKHGKFNITLGNAIYHKQGCPKCAREKSFFPLEEAKKQCKEKYGDYYTYNWDEYVSKRKKITITCPKHGEFKMSMFHHLNCSNGCPKCGREHANEKMRDSFSTFLTKAKKIHGDKFTYDEGTYNNNKSKLLITCNVCGFTFPQFPFRHLDGDGCPICNKNVSKLENELEELLMKENINYIPQWSDSFLKNKRMPKTIDFYLPEYNTAIECQGIQHFQKVEYFRDKLEYTVKNDIFKNKQCEEHGIHVLYFLPSKFKTIISKSDIFNNSFYTENNTFFDVKDLIKTIIDNNHERKYN